MEADISLYLQCLFLIYNRSHGRKLTQWDLRFSFSDKKRRVAKRASREETRRQERLSLSLLYKKLGERCQLAAMFEDWMASNYNSLSKFCKNKRLRITKASLVHPPNYKNISLKWRHFFSHGSLSGNLKLGRLTSWNLRRLNRKSYFALVFHFSQLLIELKTYLITFSIHRSALEEIVQAFTPKSRPCPDQVGVEGIATNTFYQENIPSWFYSILPG